VLTSEEVRDFLVAEGYDVDRIYSADNPAGENPTNYNNGPVWFYDSGDPLPADLLMPGFAWDGNGVDITNNITDGRFLFFHRDHGGSRNFFNHDTGGWGGIEGWGDPLYQAGNVAGLANGDLLPVLFSVDCQCGWFDGETDQTNDAALTGNTESICEMFVRQNGGGSVAAIG
ncbi:MAG: C25 family cysteine peptidase, partial [Candidatus Heimdallarchaeota archaeon]